MRWEKVRLGDVTDSCLGKMLDPKKNKGEYKPYLANVNVRWGEFDLDNLPQQRYVREGFTSDASIMKMLNLIGIGERAGSGVPDIFATWEQQGWKEPEVEEQYGPDRTILTLSFIKKVVARSDNENKNMVSDHDSEHVSDHDDSYEDKKHRLQEFCAVPRTRQEMQDFLGIASRGYFSRRFIVPMVNEGKLKMTIPDKPKSRNQKYIKA